MFLCMMVNISIRTNLMNIDLYKILAESTRIHGYKKFLKGKKLAYIKNKKKNGKILNFFYWLIFADFR